MAKVFLDTNIFLDIVYRKLEIRRILSQQQVFASSLSVHIHCYVNKIKIPNIHLYQFLENEIEIVDFSSDILQKALSGPTVDLEDNIQLHSAAEAECDFFLTSDQKLLDMKFFGKTRIASTLQQS